MTSKGNPYRDLGVPEDATYAVIGARYRALAREFHPDVSGGNLGKVERFKQVTAAYNALKTPVSRAKVDEDLRIERNLHAAATAVRRRKPKNVAKPTRATPTAGRDRVVPSRASGRRPKPVRPNRPVPTSFIELGAAIARSRPQSEALWWILGGAAAEYLRRSSR